MQKIKDRFSGFKYSAIFPVVYLMKLLAIIKRSSFFSEVSGILIKLPGIKYLSNLKFSNRLKFNKVRLAVIISAVTAILIAAFWFSLVQPRLYKPNIKKTVMIYIHSNADYQQVLQLLTDEDVFRNIYSFDWLARKKKYPALIKPGAYRLEAGWNNIKVLRILQYGIQTPVKVTFNNIRFREDLAGHLAKCFETDSLTFLSYLNNDSLAKSLGFTHERFPCIFIPNTYEFYWTTPPRKFIERMKKEYDIFWNQNRKDKAKNLGLSAPEVITLASIVQEETNMNEEKSKIAAVYINRLHQDWFLQADPTVKFAIGDFSIKRILHAYTTIDSPFNTYKYKGLPPGPINFPEIQSIDAVLNSEKNDYMYFCAKEDFSGFHRFSKTLSEHLLNARKYQAALNKNKILR